MFIFYRSHKAMHTNQFSSSYFPMRLHGCLSVCFCLEVCFFICPWYYKTRKQFFCVNLRFHITNLGKQFTHTSFICAFYIYLSFICTCKCEICVDFVCLELDLSMNLMLVLSKRHGSFPHLLVIWYVWTWI